MSDTTAYDLVVIGSGPGGYVCAIKAAQLGLKVAVVEKRKTYGGTCLNVGCIPSKALLHASEMFAEASHSFGELGIKVQPELDLAAMLGHKDKTVKANVDGIAFLFKKNKIDGLIGTGRIKAAGEVEVTAEDGSAKTLQAKAICIATGSEVAGIPGVDVTFDETVIVSSDHAIALPSVPKHLVVVGGGVIGLELGSVWSRLGAKVTVVEYLGKVLGGMDTDLSNAFQKLLAKQGVEFKLNAKVTKVEKGAAGAAVTFEPVAGGEAEVLEADVVLVATGRRPYTEGLGLDDLGIARDKAGRVEIDDHFQTSLKGVYAIGDVVRGAMLAHKAEDEGVALAEILAGQAGHVNYGTIPSVVYTSPEVASVGKTEDELKKEGVAYRAGKFNFTANGRARAMLATDGFVKVLADATTDRVLGVHVLGHSAGDLIAEAAVLMEFGGAAEDLARTSHAHPTLSEAVREAAFAAFCGKPIHA
ncbi:MULTISPECIES: dihydrolipoyl dehydrogenase [unclassified Aureimonas]|uniref:dihydrolipoyl dehydrogenase n=1 Tax=unclassified Aureimonas TaxID=2615206 RepID=UPI0006F7CB4B|nr:MULTISPECIES: dihydrolipoyl dehydrogenase [unclassified Aureimonas]KQT52628.1 dihydrolipoamide dehydrogenase [Aureimonas sp. Leaf427]KQT77473.1 dihydrolipoamide dehydrogenase [Aureimonas sp. Leaf460]